MRKVFTSEDKMSSRRAGLLKSRTPSELRLEAELAGRGVEYVYQRPVGYYFVDLHILPNKLAVEVDGWYHFNKRQRRNDEYRTKQLRAMGWRVMRFTNNEVCTDVRTVAEKIIAERDRFTTWVASKTM